MWLLTPFGFFSIVRKPDDVAQGSLTIRARVRSDLETLRDQALPELGPVCESSNTDYRYRARAPQAAVARAMAQLVETLDYSNFKDEVAKRQGSKRAKLYHDVWRVLHRMQGDRAFEKSPARQASRTHSASASSATRASRSGAAPGTVPTAQSYGGVAIDALRRVLLIEPAGHFGGYVWTFPKGRPDKGEGREETALREVREETGYAARIVAAIDRVFPGTTVSTAYFVIEVLGEPGGPTPETARICWATESEARELIGKTTTAKGIKRDLAVLEAALAVYDRASA